MQREGRGWLARAPYMKDDPAKSCSVPQPFRVRRVGDRGARTVHRMVLAHSARAGVPFPHCGNHGNGVLSTGTPTFVNSHARAGLWSHTTYVPTPATYSRRATCPACFPSQNES